MQLFDEISKAEPTTQDVHVSTAEDEKKKKGTFKMNVPITKTQEDQRLVFGWASIIEKDGKTVVDSQGDMISEGDLENAFYDFAKDARGTGQMHEGAGFGDLVECMVFTKQKQEALGIDLGKVGAWVGFRVPQEIFAKVKSGEYPAFSIQGYGKRVEA